MRKLSKLAALPLEEQHHVVRLCETNTYESVVITLARPRSEGGLNFQTSRSALSRFVSTFHPEVEQAESELEKLKALLAKDLADDSADPAHLPAAIRTLIERDILARLVRNEPIEKLRREFRIMFKLRQLDFVKKTTGKRIYPLAPGTVPPKSPDFPRFPPIP